MMTWFLIALWVSGEKTFILLQNMDLPSINTSIGMMPLDGSILLHSGSRLQHWDRHGSLLATIDTDSQKENAAIYTAYYDSAAKIYWLVTDASGLVFFDEHGAFLGEGYTFVAGEKSDVNYRRLLPAGRRVFGYLIVDLWENPVAEVLVQLDYHRDESGNFLVSNAGRPFVSTREDERKMNQTFKEYWVLEDPYHRNLYVLYELSSYIRHFVPFPGDGSRLQEQEKRIRLSLPDYVPPPKAWNKTLRSKDQVIKWVSSWSRISGFYSYGDGFLVGYLVPHPQNVGQSIQAMQRISLKGANIGRMKTTEGQLIGTYDGKVFIYLKNRKGLEVLAL